MINQSDLFRLVKKGKVEGFISLPKITESVISRVFVFEKEKKVLKIYKRDNAFWNKEMNDLSKGHSRISFIREDFSFNQFLNPKIYSDLKTACIKGDRIELSEPNESDDELVIVMNQENVAKTLTRLLYEDHLSDKDFEKIGAAFARVKLAFPKRFLPEMKTDWHAQMRARIDDVEAWVMSEKSFPVSVARKGVKKLRILLETNRTAFQTMVRENLFVSIDCNSENLVFDGELRFMDAYPPKAEWRIAAFELDILRTAADILGLAGEMAHECFLKGVRSVTKFSPPEELRLFYMLYGAMIDAPYFFMLSHKDLRYRPVAERYFSFVEKLIG